jgi:hypothetical protein
MRTTIKVLAVGILWMLGTGIQGCGGRGDGEDIAKFTGTWRAISGTSTVSCPGRGADTSPVDGTIVWSRGVSSDLVQTLSSTCVINAEVMGATAAGSAAPCTMPSGETTVTLTLPNYTFVISPDGRTATENGSGTFLINGGGVAVTCALSETASYQKLSQ